MQNNISKRVFLLSKLRYFVDTDTRNLFFSAHIKPDIDYASVLWDGCSDAFKKRLNHLNRRAGKLILMNTNQSTDPALKELETFSLHQQLKYNKGLFMHKDLNYAAPEYISNLYTHPPSRYSNSRNRDLDLPRPRIDNIENKHSLFWCSP